MNLKYVAQRLQEVGWKAAPRMTYAGERFDLQFTHHIRLEPWVVLIQAIPVLDIFSLLKMQSRLEWVFTITKGKVWGRNFVLYLVAGKVTQQALHALQVDQMNLLRFSQKRAGTRKIIVVDEANHQFHGPYPALQSFEKQPPFDLSHIFQQALSPDGVAFPSPIGHDDVASLIDRLLPASALQLIGDSDRPDLAAARIEAFGELDRLKEADEGLDKLLPELQGDELGRMQRFKARYLFAQARVDEGIWMLEQASCNTHDADIRAAVISTKANGYAIKHCFRLAEDAIREALQVAPDQPRVSFALAQLYLQTDRRLEARDVLERMHGDSEQWVNCYIDFELANIALLLGEFDESRRLAQSALDYSPEIINPLITQTYLAMLSDDLPQMDGLIAQIEARSPKAEVLAPIRLELERLRKRKAASSLTPAQMGTDMAATRMQLSGAPSARRQRRLESFPSLVQRRNHCGPSTIELVLRYWKGGLELTNTDIASRVMLPGSGTPIYRMTEFFHLVGFDTLRCIAPTGTLMQLVDAGFPTIIDLTSGGIGHVTVVIGYDEDAGVIELQDPMTHHVLPMPVDELNRLRLSLFNSAIVAYPAGKGHTATLAKMGLFPDETLALLDKASQALEVGDHASVCTLMEQASRLRPQHGLVWAYWLETLARQWQSVVDHMTILPTQSDSNTRQQLDSVIEAVRSQFYAVLERARSALPDMDFTYFFAGRAALLDADLPRALAALQKTHELSPNNADTMATMAECLFSMNQVERALESAREAIRLDPGSIGGNVWMARCLGYLHMEHADYYARIGLELAPAWWMAHLAMAEVHLTPRPYKFFQPEAAPTTLLNPPQAAWQELDAVLSRAPSQPEALVLRAHLLMSTHDFPSAQAVLDSAFQFARTPMALHRVHQALCMLFFRQGKLDQATIQVTSMLAVDPENPWAHQFRADLEFRKLQLSLASTPSSDPSDLDIVPLRELYLKAIQVNNGSPNTVQPFLENLRQLGKLPEAVEQAKSLSEQYPDKSNLSYLHAAMLRISGPPAEAATCMLEALAKPGAILGRDALCYAFETIIQALGPEKGEEAILNVKLPPSINDRERDFALGTILSFHPKERGARARQLLESALADNPDDFEATFWLSNVAMNETEHEALLKKTVFLAPHWTHARMVLSGFLIDKKRYKDALEFTTGHEYESLDMLARHVISLNSLGDYEQAAPAVDRLVNDPSLPGNRPSRFYWWKFWIEVNCGEYKQAIDTAYKAQALFQNEHDWYYLSAFALYKSGRFDEAKAVLVEGKEKGCDGDLVREGYYWIALSQEDWQTAFDIAKRAQEAAWNILPSQKDPDVTMLKKWSHRYLLMLIDQGRQADAEKYLDVIFKDSRVWESTTNDLASRRDNSLTLACAERVLGLSNITATARYYALWARAIAYRNEDDTQARQAFEDVRDQFPLDALPVAQLALYAALEGDLPQATRLADQAVVQDRHVWQSWATRGLVRLLNGQRASALSDLKSAWNRTVELYITGFSFWWLYFSLLGDIPNAKKYRDKAIAQAESTFDQQLIDVIKSLISQKAS